MVKTWRHDELDFGGMKRDLGQLVAPKMTLREVLEKLREPLREQMAAGVTIEQMQKVLETRGVKVGLRTLRQFLAGSEPRQDDSAKPAPSEGALDSFE